MKRKIVLYVTLTFGLHVALAVGEYAAMRMAERSGLPIFANLEPALVFSDVPLYHEHANRAFAGQVPYRDDPIEYPLLALPFLFAPRLIARTKAAFVVAFAAEMLLCDAAIIALVAWRVAQTSGPAKVPAALGWLSASFAAIAPFVMGRYDAVPALLGFASACSWFGSRPALGGALAAVGALVKIAPGAVALPGIAAEMADLRRSRGRGAVAFALVLGVGIACWFAIGGAGAIAAIRYHSDRGIEVGSLPSGLLWVRAIWTGDPVRLSYDHQSLNLIARGSEVASSLAFPIQLAFLGIAVASFYRKGMRQPFRVAGAAVLGFAIGGKVLSPQYLIWVLPFVAAMTGRAGRWSRPPFLLASILTALLYPWAFGALAALRPWACVALNLRNLALLVTFATMVGFPSGDRGTETQPTAVGP